MNDLMMFCAQIESTLHRIFPPEERWGCIKYKRYPRAVCFSRWHDLSAGFALMDCSSGKDIAIGVYFGHEPDGGKFIRLMRSAQSAIRERLGHRYLLLDEANRGFPISEDVPYNRRAIAQRLTLWRDTLSPYLDRLLPRLDQNCCCHSEVIPRAAKKPTPKR